MNPKEKLTLLEYKIRIYKAKLRYNKYQEVKLKTSKIKPFKPF